MGHQGSTGNVIAAVCSFFVPGLGQLVQGRAVAAVLFFLMACGAWVLGVVSFGVLAFLAVVPHLWATLNAALWRRGGRSGDARPQLYP